MCCGYLHGIWLLTQILQQVLEEGQQTLGENICAQKTYEFLVTEGNGNMVSFDDFALVFWF